MGSIDDFLTARSSTTFLDIIRTVNEHSIHHNSHAILLTALHVLLLLITVGSKRPALKLALQSYKMFSLLFDAEGAFHAPVNDYSKSAQYLRTMAQMIIAQLPESHTDVIDRITLEMKQANEAKGATKPKLDAAASSTPAKKPTEELAGYQSITDEQDPSGEWSAKLQSIKYTKFIEMLMLDPLKKITTLSRLFVDIKTSNFLPL